MYPYLLIKMLSVRFSTARSGMRCQENDHIIVSQKLCKHLVLIQDAMLDIHVVMDIPVAFDGKF